jgi:hypothetical protein
MAYEATVVLDSISPAGVRLTTIEARYPRFIHPELLTHRVFSRNASSNRALPIKRVIREVIHDPVVPVWWGKTQRGMVAEVEMIGWRRWLCTQLWLKARYIAVALALVLCWLGLHRQLVNRLLEPWQWITTVFTATEWDNFWKLRAHMDAQPECQRIAMLMWSARYDSQPVKREWHLPYVRENELMLHTLGETIELSVARCARTSYLSQHKPQPRSKDFELYARLVKEEPIHSSPMEHVAKMMPPPYATDYAYNLRGWRSWRYLTDEGIADDLRLDQRAA